MEAANGSIVRLCSGFGGPDPRDSPGLGNPPYLVPRRHANANSRVRRAGAPRNLLSPSGRRLTFYHYSMYGSEALGISP